MCILVRRNFKYNCSITALEKHKHHWESRQSIRASVFRHMITSWLHTHQQDGWKPSRIMCVDITFLGIASFKKHLKKNKQNLALTVWTFKIKAVKKLPREPGSKTSHYLIFLWVSFCVFLFFFFSKIWAVVPHFTYLGGQKFQLTSAETANEYAKYLATTQWSKRWGKIENNLARSIVKMSSICNNKGTSRYKTNTGFCSVSVCLYEWVCACVCVCMCFYE